MRLIRSIFFLSLGVPLLPAAAEVIGVYRAWTAVTVSKEKKNTCMIWTQPKRSRGFKGKRGDVFAFVTHQPSEDRINRVSFETGYELGARPNVLVRVDDDTFSLNAQGTGAWTRSGEDDLALIAAMRDGQVMTVESETGDGALIRDRFSLIGFTAAYKAINTACKVL
jgi:invasion protein IalB